MKFKRNFFNIIKLCLILFLLFWCFTLDLPSNFNLTFEDSRSFGEKIEIKEDSSSRSDAIFIKKYLSNIPESSRKKYKSGEHDKSVSFSGSLIPSFTEWREMEIAKYAKDFARDRILHQDRKLSRRKLNYASSKCGAKILVSNPEARHRLAVLSERSEEYFLNPCRVRTWFVIELCDAVEVTQVELANYELYSSSPKEFSVFWSDVYPTFQWHFLGNFAAKDERSMQTFDIKEKNLGKFIKVIIHSHHGKQHYCPLSVVRVLGFSMEQNVEEEGNNYDSGLQDATGMKFIKAPPSEETNFWRKSIGTEVNDVLRNNSYFYAKDICDKFFIQCSNTCNVNVDHLGPSCQNKPTCRFLDEILKKCNINCLQLYSPRYPALFLMAFNSFPLAKLKTAPLNLKEKEADVSKDNFDDHVNEKDIIKDYEHENSLRIKKYCQEKLEKTSDRIGDCRTVGFTKKLGNEEAQLSSAKPIFLYDEIARMSDYKLIWGKDIDKTQAQGEIKLAMKNKHVQKQKDTIQENESAGLINKESVIFKLSIKLRNSEMEVNLINKYLQQLSQSYRYQMEEMKNRINNTVQEMTTASEKAAIINANQEKRLNVLKADIEILKHKTDYLMKEKNHQLKRVIELHGFFLILEIIIITTVFSIFLNALKKQTFAVKYKN